MTDLATTVVAAQRGERAAFATLVRSHQDLVCAVALAVTRRVDTSEDVAQQVFVTAWRRLGELREPARFSGWIRALAHRLALRHDRTDRRHDARVRRAELDVAAPATPEAVLLEREQRDLLDEALGDLSEDDRVLLTLYYREAHTTRELGALLDVSEAGVRKRLQRARTALRDRTEARLAGVLRGSRPGAAFTAAVLAAIAAWPVPVHAATGSGGRRLGAAGLAAGLLLVGGAWWAQGGHAAKPEVAAREQGPAHTARAHEALQQAAAPAEPVVAPPGQRQPYELLLRVNGERSAFRPNVIRHRSIRPHQFFPSAEEVPLPELRTTWALQQALELEARGKAADTPALLAVADGEGLTLSHPGLLAEPWRALLILEVERRRVRARYQAAYDAHYEGFHLGLPREQIVRVNQTKPRADYRAFVATADRLLVTFADHPVADFLRLYLLEAHFDIDSAQEDPALGTATALDLIEATDDALVLQAAVQRLSDGWGLPPLRPADRALLEDQLGRLPARLHPAVWHVLAVGALGTEDWDEAARFNDRARQLARATCPHWPAFSLQTGEIPRELVADLQCVRTAEDIDRLEGRIAQARGTRPDTWRPALVAAVWQCRLDLPWDAKRTDRSVTTEVVDGAWRWGAWTRTDPLTACVDAAVAELPIPPEGWVVDLTLIR